MRTLRNRWFDVAGLIFALAAAGALMFALLPQQTQPGQQVVPALPASASEPLQAFLTIFVVMTTVGAPVTMAIVLALVLRWVSKQVPASSTAAEAASKSAKVVKPASERAATAALSSREETFWKIAATVLALLITGGVVAAVWPELVRLFSR
jgi:uncharacterized MAPEG superfamily protein